MGPSCPNEPQVDSDGQDGASPGQADYLVPISVVVEHQQPTASHLQQQAAISSSNTPEANANSRLLISSGSSQAVSKNPQPKIESIAWSIIDACTSKVLSTRALEVRHNEPKQSTTDSALVVGSLAEAIAQVSGASERTECR